MRVASCLWTVRPALVEALARRLGPPLDAYLNGSHTWHTDAGPGADDGRTLEWRLHPAPGYRAPRGTSPYDCWDTVLAQLRAGADPDHLRLGEETRTLRSLWEGLECFVAFGDDLEPARLAATATERLGIPPDACGLVDHERVAAAWERNRGATSILDLLREQLRP